MTPQTLETVIPRTVDYVSLKHLLPQRSQDSHKGDFGHVLVVGGDSGFGGAVLMAAEAAARTGAGLVSVGTHPSHVASVLARCPELMVKGIEYAEDLSVLIPKAKIIVVGPGLGQSDWSCLNLKMVLDAQKLNPVPLVMDADALNLISKGSFMETADRPQWILTPHPGEAARLLQCSRDEIQSDRVQAVQKLQSEYGGIAILKGAGTLICYQQSKRLQIDRCVHGNPGMASGGMGDILSGVLGSLLAQGFTLADAARLGVCLHSKSADIAAKESGERGLLATDLLPFIHRLVNPL